MPDSKPKHFALFHDGSQIGKSHSTAGAAITEAFERKAVIKTMADFGDWVRIYRLVPGYEIREVAVETGSEPPSLPDIGDF